MRPSINRREFLRQGALGMAAASAYALVPPVLLQSKIERAGAPKKVIVIGAGLAGLVAAYELSQAGHDLTILEARLRPGGRVYTLREPFSDGLYAEAGAARIPDTHALTLKYAKLFDLALDPFYPRERAFLTCVRGKRLRNNAGAPPDLSQLPLELSPEERKLGPGGMWQKYVTPVLKELGDAAAPGWPPASLKKFDEITFYEFLRRQGASPGAVAFLTMGWDFGNMSALAMLRMEALDQNARTRFKIRGGNDRLPKAFAARLTEKIRYGSPVTRIESDARGVRVISVQAGAHQTLAADRLICTIPFPVLRRVETAPPFSPGKRRAIQETSYLSVTRVFLQSRKRFWEEAGLNGFGLADHPAEIWHPTFDQPGPRGILLSYITGAPARRVGAMKDAERIRFVLDQMEQVHPGIRASFEGGASKFWDEDEWARGAAAEFDAGQMTALLPHMAAPEGRVHFAGEHTSPWPGWMQGALYSGLRAAQEVNQAP